MSTFGSKVGPHETAKPGDPLPPVVILNLSYSGLGIARDMTGRGARVVGLSSDQKIYGNFTRACEVWPAPMRGGNRKSLPISFFELPASSTVRLFFPRAILTFCFSTGSAPPSNRITAYPLRRERACSES
jgi:hypothetical protein